MKSLSQQDRINAIAPRIRELVGQYASGTFAEGGEALNAQVTELVENAGLVEVRSNVAVDKVGCFPGNRFGSMLIPVDVHYLISNAFFVNGWNSGKWDCMALTIPPALRHAWVQANRDLVTKSEGLLPEVVDMNDLVTGRGSHGMAALRGIKFGCRTSDPNVADDSGRVSMAKVIQKQPSMRTPLETGVTIMVLPGELEVACPGVFKLLSEVGNVSNASYRLKTVLQTCQSIHAMAKQSDCSDESWARIRVQAAMGLPKHEADRIDDICSFVCKWSGGDDGHILQNLEDYEKTLNVRRKIRSDDLGKLASCDLDDAPHIVPVAWELH